MNPDKYTNDQELIELRLQLHHEKMRADNLWEVVKFERAERKRLEAEVERLESDLKLEKENEDRIVRLWQTANNEVHGQATQIAALIDNQTSLKAEVERSTAQYNGIIDTQLKVIDELKAEVERLNTGIQPEGCNDAVGRAVELLLEKEKEIARLKAENEELQNRCDFLEGRGKE